MSSRDKVSLESVLNRSAIHRLAGARYFERGEDYFFNDCVAYLSEDNNVITASVNGSRRYKVRLWAEDSDLNYDCSCPLGREGEFCKHCVAVGLEWLHEKNDSKKPNTQNKKALKTSETDIREYLTKQDKNSLTDIIVDQMHNNDNLRERLILRLNRAVGEGINVEHFKRLINRAVQVSDFLHSRQMWDYVSNINEVVWELEKVLEDGNAAEAIDIAEYFIDEVEKAMQYVDDSDGGMGGILNDLQNIHLRVCKIAKPEPRELARRLFKKEVIAEFDVFYDAVVTYRDVLGDEGVSVYRKLAEERWDTLLPLKPGDEDDYSSERFHVTRIIEVLARQDRDIEKLVAIKSKNLSRVCYFLGIALIYREAGDKEKALEWAEEGLKAFPEKTDIHLREFLAQEYHARGRHEEAIRLIWKEFDEYPILDNYKKLHMHASKNKTWHAWREKALAYIKQLIKKEGKRKKPSFYGDHTNYSGLLVEIYIWEKEIENAWKQAKEGGCGKDTWLKLAGLRENDHPQDAVEVYKLYVKPALDQTNNQAYEEAVEYLKNVKKLMCRMNKDEEFKDYLNDLCAGYKRKKNFIKMIDRAKW